MTLLEKARSIPAAPMPNHGIDHEFLELAVAFFNGEVKIEAAAKACGKSRNNFSGAASTAIRSAIRSGAVPKIKLEDQR